MRAIWHHVFPIQQACSSRVLGVLWWGLILSCYFLNPWIHISTFSIFTSLVILIIFRIIAGLRLFWGLADRRGCIWPSVFKKAPAPTYHLIYALVCLYNQ